MVGVSAPVLPAPAPAVGTADGVVVRPVAPVEAEHVVDAVFAGLSPRSRFLRFHSSVPRLPSTVRAALAAVDGRRHAAVVAVAPGVGPVGVARVIGPGGGRADLAVAVVDAWQRRGLGGRLLTAVTALAEDLGHTELRGAVLPENAAMLALARRLLPGVRSHYDGEVVELIVPLGAGRWTITEEDLLADLLSR